MNSLIGKQVLEPTECVNFLHHIRISIPRSRLGSAGESRRPAKENETWKNLHHPIESGTRLDGVLSLTRHLAGSGHLTRWLAKLSCKPTSRECSIDRYQQARLWQRGVELEINTTKIHLHCRQSPTRELKPQIVIIFYT